MIVVGLDLSLNATGVATPTGELTWSPVGDMRKGEWMFHLACRLEGTVRTADLVVAEDLPRNPKFGGPALGMVHGLFHKALWTEHAYDKVVLVTPATVKKFATGKGNAAKDEMLAAAIRRLGYGGHDHNQADAMWLRAIGHHLAGIPLVELPKAHTDTLAKLTLPERLVAS